MSATPFAVRTLCRCWIAAFGSRYTRPAAVDATGTAISDIGGIVVFVVSRTVRAWLNVLLPGVFGWFSTSLVSFWSRRLAVGFEFVKVPSLLRGSTGRTQPRWILTHCLRHSIASTCWFMKRVPIMTSTARESATTNGRWNNELPKLARMSATPRSRKGRPFASPSRGTVSFRTRYRSRPSNKALFRIKFGPEPVSNPAEKGRRFRGSGPTEQDTTYCVVVRTHTRSSNRLGYRVYGP